MNKLVLFSYREEVGKHYMTHLQKLFSGVMNLQLYSLEAQPHPEEVPEYPADIALMTTPEPLHLFRRMFRPNTSIISLDFSYSLENIEKLKSYPTGTRVKLHASFPSVRKNMIRLFYEQGISDLVWVDEKDEGPFDLLVIDNLSSKPFPEARQVLDLGQRKISFNTLLQIASTACLLNKEVETSLFEYAEGYRSVLSIFPFLYSDLATSHSQLRAVLNGIDDAVAILDHTLQMVQCNSSFISLFPCVKTAGNTPLPKIPEMSFLEPCLRSNQPVKNMLISPQKDNDLVVSVERVAPGLEQSISYILIVQLLNDMENKEKAVRHQLALKGYRARYTFGDIKSASPEMNLCMRKARVIAGIDKTTLIIGESGVGKELIAQAIHSDSNRGKFPFVSINCAAIPPSLLESELFGYSEGAFTGSKRGGKKGLFEIAHRGTFFLDEIGEALPETQSKLLRVIETKEITRIGADAITTVDVRIIAATNKNLKELVKQKQFRLDLYYRLNTIILHVPPLRQRKEDILPLADYFIQQETGAPRGMTQDMSNFLLSYNWDGNVRELRNVVEYMANMTPGMLGIEHLPDYILEDFPRSTYKEDSVPATNDGFLRERYNHAELRLIMRLFGLISAGYCSRDALHRQLALSGDKCSAHRLRRYLEDLRDMKYLNYGKGPKGIYLSKIGIDFLEK